MVPEAENIIEKEKNYFKDRKIVELAKATFPNSTNQHYTKGAVSQINLILYFWCFNLNFYRFFHRTEHVYCQ